MAAGDCMSVDVVDLKSPIDDDVDWDALYEEADDLVIFSNNSKGHPAVVAECFFSVLPSYGISPAALPQSYCASFFG